MLVHSWISKNKNKQEKGLQSNISIILLEKKEPK